jgi:hypothetical protein
VAVGGTFRILTNRDAALDLDGSSASASLRGLDPDFYSVMGRKTFTAAGYEEYQAKYPYRNRDGTYSDPVRRLWLVIHPDGGGAKKFGLSLTIEEPSMAG